MAAIAIAIVGAGAAGSAMIDVCNQHAGVRLAAICDPGEHVRAQYSQRPDVKILNDVGELAGVPEIEAVYIATPTPLHCSHAIAAANLAKHVVVEKPMAVSMHEADAMVAAAKANNVTLIIGHSHSFEAPIRAMRAIIEAGELGQLRAINGWYYSDWMFRPREEAEFDTRLGGGVVFRQGAHHADIVRFLGGGLLATVRARLGDWDPARPGNGSYSAYLEFEDGVPVTLFYSGYDRFGTAELTFGMGENGQIGHRKYAAARKNLSETRTTHIDRPLHKQIQRDMLQTGEGQPCFGLLVVSCERGDIRISPDGLITYGDKEMSILSLQDQPGGREEMLNELVRAIRGESPPVHDGTWGRANLEVCIGMLRSSEERREVRLQRQTALPPGAAHLSLPSEIR